MSDAQPPPQVSVALNTPVPWLRLEGLAFCIGAVIAFHHLHYSWILFAVLFFAPDFSFAAYLGGPRLGALVYNLLHAYFGALLLGALLAMTGITTAIPLIWIAHIGFDRALG
jgi:hypothetical protein